MGACGCTSINKGLVAAGVLGAGWWWWWWWGADCDFDELAVIGPD